MKILLFSNSESVYDTVLMCQTKDTTLQIERVKYDRIKSMALTSKQDLYIIDDECIEELDKSYLNCLKEIRAEVVVIVSDLKRLSRYIGFNVVEYFCVPVSLMRMATCIQRVCKRKYRLIRISEIRKRSI